MTRFLCRTAVVAFLTIIIGGAIQAGVAAPPTVTITASRITVTGVTPGAGVMFFGAGFEPMRDHAVVHRWSTVVTDTDLDGSVFYDLAPSVTWNALWIVADLSSGEYKVASTPGYPVMRASLPRQEFKRTVGGAVGRFAYSRPTADFLYVVPGGAWTLLARDGEPTDSDLVADGATEVDLTQLQPVVNGELTPEAFVAGGTLFAIDTSRLDLMEIKIDAPRLAGAQ